MNLSYELPNLSYKMSNSIYDLSNPMYELQNLNYAKRKFNDYDRAVQVMRRFRRKIHSLTLPKWGKLYYLTKTNAFCQWYYDPANIGGKIEKQRFAKLTSQIQFVAILKDEPSEYAIPCCFTCRVGGTNVSRILEM